MLLVDSSCLLAALDAGEPDHKRVHEIIARQATTLLVTDFVLAEVDYLVLKRLGVGAEQDFIQQVLDGIFVREPITAEDLLRASEIASDYSEHRLGITDTSLMALSERKRVHEILTLDRRHFGLFRDRRGGAPTLLPD